ncbi:MAG: ATP-binding protein, partial [Candidatus Thiodiazotropha sp.]
MNAPQEFDWTAANQKLLVAEFARLRALLGDGDAAEAQAEVERCLGELPNMSAIDDLTDRFALSRFERDILLLAAGLEMDSALAALCQSNTGHSHATFGLAMAVLP